MRPASPASRQAASSRASSVADSATAQLDPPRGAHHGPPRPRAGYALLASAFSQRRPPVPLGDRGDGRLWLAQADGRAFVDWAREHLTPGAAPALILAIGAVVVPRLREAPETRTRFADAEALATTLVRCVHPGRDRFHGLRMAVDWSTRPAARALAVATLIAGLARQRGMAHGSQVQLTLAGLCLDLGATLLPLDAPADIARRHPLLGADLLVAQRGTHDGLGLLRAGIAGHHERVDGAGEPVGLSGEGLSLAARITGLCDRAVDALSAPRVGPRPPPWLALERLADDHGAVDRRLLVDLVRLLARRTGPWTG